MFNSVKWSVATITTIQKVYFNVMLCDHLLSSQVRTNSVNGLDEGTNLKRTYSTRSFCDKVHCRWLTITTWMCGFLDTPAEVLLGQPVCYQFSTSSKCRQLQLVLCFPSKELISASAGVMKQTIC